jgi:hypothetical protein
MKSLLSIRISRSPKLILALILLALLAPRTFAGSIDRLIYYDTGTAVSNLVSSGIFPDLPSFEEQLDDFTPPVYGFQSKNDSQYSPESFGSYTRGYLEAPTNGNYIFFIASDNASELWLSTDDTTNNLQLIAYETNSGTALFSGPRLSQRESAPITLVGGQKYYLEVYHQASSADSSYVEVGWERPDGVQEIIPALHLAQYPVDLYRNISYTAPVFNTLGFNGGNLPTTVTTNEGSPLILQLDVIAAQPTTFLWYSNGVPVPGANLSYLEFPAIRAAANNSVYQVVVTNVYGSITSAPATLAITPDTTPPVVTQVSPQGNPNALIVSYSKPVDPVTSTALANYTLQVQGGSSLVITNATLLAGQQTVELSGPFNFQVGGTYQLTVANILDQDTTPNTLSPNPTITTFTNVPPAGTLYNFSTTATNGFTLYGYANITSGGGYDGNGYADLTDAAQYEEGALQFASPGTVSQFDLSFEASIGGASATPGDGFSINLGNDLPQGIFLNAQEGYSSLTSPSSDGLTVAFDNDLTVQGVVTPSIVVRWQGNVITNVPTGVGGIPPINSADGHWAYVNLQLQEGGSLSLVYDSVLIFTNLATGFVPVQNGQLEIAAQTGVNYETHWFDDVNVNYAQGDIGPVGFASNPSLTNITVLENTTANFAVYPNGASPYYYQWYNNGTAITGATNSILSVFGALSAAGNYSVVVSNWFSQTSSVTATLTVTPDTTPPQLVSARGFAGGVNEVLLTFDKPLNPASATNTATYNLGFLSLYSASLSADGQTVTLTTGTLDQNQLYLFSINGLQDTTAEHNQLTTKASFVATVDYAAEIILNDPIRYWRFDEPAGSSTVSSLTTGADALSLGVGTLDNSPTLGVPSLVPSEPQDPAILFTASDSQYISVPNGVDINITDGPWLNKSFEFWFNANTVPAPGTTGLAATAGIFKEGAATRGVNFYLWRNPSDPNPAEAELIFNAFDNASDGAGSPWGVSSGPPSATPAIYAQATVEAGETYHVVGVYAGNAATNGTLTLYINGVPVSTVGGVGELYNHSGNIEIGAGGTTTLDINGDSGALGYFDGVLDDLSLYNSALSSNTVAAHYQVGTNAISSTAALAVSRIDTLGDPNQILLTFNQAVTGITATNLANYVLKTAAGTAITITNASLLAGDSTVQLAGKFGFLGNSNYTLTVSGITDQSIPAGTLTPNPTNVAFAFSAPTGTTYNFNAGLPEGVEIFGSAYLTNFESADGNNYVDLTDATTNENGALLFTEPHDVEQFDISFKARLSNGSTPPGSGFSVNIGTNLPSSTFSTPEKGYLPSANPGATGLIVAFDNDSNNPPSISVLLHGNTLTNVLTGANGIPPLNNTAGDWVNVDINLQINGDISVSYAGVTVITNLPTGFETLIGAQVGFGAATTASYETHWFDDINLNFDDGSIGPVTIPASGQPQGSTNEENELVNLGVSPAGTAPFGYQWYYTNAPLIGATNRTLTFSAETNVAGPYFVVVSDAFSSATSTVANVAVQTDLTPPSLTNVVAYGGSLNKVILSFNKLLSPASATNLLTYSITSGGLVINSATLNTNGTTVTLLTSQQQNLQTNVLAINGLLDLAAFPHALYTSVTFQSGVSYAGEVLADDPVRFWPFDETNGTIAYSELSVTDSLITAQGTYNNSPLLGVPGLVPNSTGTAVQLNAAASNSISFVATEKDVTSLTLTNRTIELWFKANTLPYATATANQAPPVWIEGAGSRYLAVYLYGTDSTTTNPSQAQLIFTGGNLVTTDGGGAGTPWGATNGTPQNAVYVSTTVTTGQVYHVVAELQGNAVPANGQLVLYTNGVVAGSVSGAGYLYTHTGAAPRVGVGSAGFRADGVAFANTNFLNGVVQDYSLYNSLLSPARIATHYQIGSTPPLVTTTSTGTPPVIGSYSVTGGNFSITWSGTAQLQEATNANGPFITISGATSPYFEPTTNARAFFRLIQ